MASLAKLDQDAVLWASTQATFVGSDATNETAVIFDSAAGSTVESDVENINLQGATTDYTFVGAAGSLAVYKDGNLIATVLAGEAPQKIVFANGSVELTKGENGAVNLGDQVLDRATGEVPFEATTLNTEDESLIAQLGGDSEPSGPSSADVVAVIEKIADAQSDEAAFNDANPNLGTDWTAAIAAVNNSVTPSMSLSDGDTVEYNNALIEAKSIELNAAVTKAEEDAVDAKIVAAADKLAASMDAYAAAVSAEQKAETEIKAAIAALGTVATSVQLNADGSDVIGVITSSVNGTTGKIIAATNAAAITSAKVGDVVLYDDGKTTASGSTEKPLLLKGENGSFALGDTYASNEYAQKLLAAINDQISKVESVETTQETAIADLKSASTLESGTPPAEDYSDFTLTAGANGEYSAALSTSASAPKANNIITAQSAVDKFDAAVAEYEEVADLKTQAEGYTKAVTEAQTELQELGIDDLGSSTTFTTGNELKIIDVPNFDGSVPVSPLTDFGVAGLDRIYFEAPEVDGAKVAYELVALDGKDPAKELVGEANIFEIFYGADAAGDIVLYAEQTAAAGSVNNVDDLVTVALTGVKLADNDVNAMFADNMFSLGTEIA